MRRQRGWGPIGPLILATAVVTACGGTPAAPTFMLAPAQSGSGAVPTGSGPRASPTLAPSGTAMGSAPAATGLAPSTLASVPSSASPSVSAASSAPTSTSLASFLAGPTIAVPGLGLSLRLPAGWIGLDSTVPPSIVNSTVARHPDLAESLARLRTGELGFLGFDPASMGATTPRITIATTGDAIQNMALLESLARNTADQLAKTGTMSDLEVMPTPLPAGPAVELRYRLRPSTSGPDLWVDSWFISAGGHTFLLTFTGPEAGGDTGRPQVRAVAESLSVG